MGRMGWVRGSGFRFFGARFPVPGSGVPVRGWAAGGAGARGWMSEGQRRGSLVGGERGESAGRGRGQFGTVFLALGDAAHARAELGCGRRRLERAVFQRRGECLAAGDDDGAAVGAIPAARTIPSSTRTQSCTQGPCPGMPARPQCVAHWGGPRGRGSGRAPGADRRACGDPLWAREARRIMSGDGGAARRFAPTR